MGKIPQKKLENALELVSNALEGGEEERAKAFDFMRLCDNKTILSKAHLLRPGVTKQTIQIALTELERENGGKKITDVEMNIRSADTRQSRSRADVTIIADNIRSIFNMGGIFRTADFFGIAEIALCGFSPRPETSPQLHKTALGADETVAYRNFNDVREAISYYKKEKNFRIYALETVDGAKDIMSFEPKYPCAFIIGNERFGIDRDVCGMADAILEIPSRGIKNSLNVVSATAIAAACLVNRQANS